MGMFGSIAREGAYGHMLALIDKELEVATDARTVEALNRLRKVALDEVKAAEMGY